ncbi:DUF6712 family protein [uncultured Bacteroides sp.]|uniref:DUF6712 family protein n=1 Tax=uncultured Bacteroides sp. TaxID=162156 RepID=UPI002AAB6C8A|nr:DUF6712 family protein [uncultured Bacteroides sp.]
MKTIFNKQNNGGEELVKALGMIDQDTTFSKWEPYIDLSVRKLVSITGSEVYDKVLELYWSSDEISEDNKELIERMQQCIALFTWVKVIPTLDAQHGNNGRQRRLGENEKGLTALQEYKDEANILNMAYESVDALIAFMDKKAFEFWINSIKKKAINKLLIKSKDEFDSYYIIGSHRLFLTLIPIIKEIQDRYIIPVITRANYDLLISENENAVDKLKDAVCRPLALLTIRQAILRLPVEILPDGIVQVQQVGTVKERIKAEADARKSVAEELEQSAKTDLSDLQDIIIEMNSVEEEPDLYILKPIINTKGVTF